ncbi:MAG: LD-carboxypeptidase [Hormoscilla sp.]
MANQKLPVSIPKWLQPGDRLRVVAPSGALRDMSAFFEGVEIWKKRGYRVELGTEFTRQWGYLAGTDAHRRQQLSDALKEEECRAILCARGGYGSTRLLEDWTWPFGKDPKWLIGFSDITALLWSQYVGGIAGLHGPVLTTLAAQPDWSRDRLFDYLEGRPLPPLFGRGWGGDRVSGILLPGNLTVATHLLGTPAQPQLEGVILAFEDVSEVPYRIDRCLTQWRMTGAIHQVHGIALGRFNQCQSPLGIPSFTVDEVLRDRLMDLKIPIVSDLPFGHDGPNAALPVGFPVYLDADTGKLEFGELSIANCELQIVN